MANPCTGTKEYHIAVYVPGTPPEISTGSSTTDNIVFNSLTDISRQGDVSATGHRLYRGIQNGLSSLPNGDDDSCAKYDGAETRTTDTSSVEGRLYWYLVTAYNGSGEGPAGNGAYANRIVNSTGNCP